MYHLNITKTILALRKAKHWSFAERCCCSKQMWRKQTQAPNQQQSNHTCHSHFATAPRQCHALLNSAPSSVLFFKPQHCHISSHLFTSAHSCDLANNPQHVIRDRDLGHTELQAYSAFKLLVFSFPQTTQMLFQGFQSSKISSLK